ncbi:uncharacterized protein BDZ83DRAFT_334003 [Colletotrichum acutatum]|uniref:Uncharacterized protein n=1 Tax=Glomerella acutata TaxID=27357 RepID=A0AAD8XNR0_GLOAC|nr:uncharacterized protein BDZ83DRAFT_334003 [Colletotrichum acutatum]KAK1730755.1 hypothetical protein BDZ83DRAFT_334003 [Colletotrichum acutatum]
MVFLHSNLGRFPPSLRILQGDVRFLNYVRPLDSPPDAAVNSPGTPSLCPRSRPRLLIGPFRPGRWEDHDQLRQQQGTWKRSGPQRFSPGTLGLCPGTQGCHWRQFEQCAQQWHNLPHAMPSRFPAFQPTAGDTTLEPAGTAQDAKRPQKPLRWSLTLSPSDGYKQVTLPFTVRPDKRWVHSFWSGNGERFLSIWVSGGAARESERDFSISHISNGRPPPKPPVRIGLNRSEGPFRPPWECANASAAAADARLSL